MTLEEAILKTLAYHDIFDYPLTKEEIYKYLIEKKASFQTISNQIQNLKSQSKIGEKRGYFFLKKQSKIARIRKIRQRCSYAKLKKALFYSQLLKSIPTIRLVGITGALAMDNSKKSDDIDLMVICAKNTLWTTRLLANLLLLPFKRDPQGKKIADRACLNLYLDESELKISPQNLYIAHEICQMKPILDRDETYSRFINSNMWVFKFLPNWGSSSQSTDHPLREASSSQIKKPSTVNRQLLTFEILLKRFQLFYMRKRISTERIGKHQLFFHPSNIQEWVMKEYQKQLKKLKI